MSTTILALDPDNPTARRWLLDELSKSRYLKPEAPKSKPKEESHTFDWLQNLFNGGWPKTIGVILLILLLIAAAYIAYRVWRETRPRDERAGDGEPGAVLGGVIGTQEEFRQAAAAALAAGDYDGAVVNAMRAIAQTASDRTLLLGAQSATAHDVARRLRHVFGAQALALHSAADAFDAVAYGGRHASADSASALVHLDTDLRDTKPTGFVDDELAEMSLPLLPPVNR
ncbi:DUF4129 domain-containing protein [Gordonia sp. (in: high G+C Gram-positive bacteria)]|uniref:DUF4129 domain-containing protein n=1 Tax=Gordonia sp. (in: high G+C Gram-positive bacteria) TaxID=84139 RepID=UPI0039E54654